MLIKEKGLNNLLKYIRHAKIYEAFNFKFLTSTFYLHRGYSMNRNTEPAKDRKIQKQLEYWNILNWVNIRKLIITQAKNLSSDFSKSLYPLVKVAWSVVPSVSSAKA